MAVATLTDCDLGFHMLLSCPIPIPIPVPMPVPSEPREDPIPCMPASEGMAGRRGKPGMDGMASRLGLAAAEAVEVLADAILLLDWVIAAASGRGECTEPTPCCFIEKRGRLISDGTARREVEEEEVPTPACAAVPGPMEDRVMR